MVLAYGFAAGFVLGVVRFEIASSNICRTLLRYWLFTMLLIHGVSLYTIALLVLQILFMGLRRLRTLWFFQIVLWVLITRLFAQKGFDLVIWKFVGISCGFTVCSDFFAVSCWFVDLLPCWRSIHSLVFNIMI
ncbi:hypothetical protein MtrunA17_Chr4g0074141 [Medicago truncatula]|uniref:Transmembrane protein n=1 Tax=Medicago truncatula TaxID=3880 RepID=A0A396IM11_MEDTR|nr:hypothetical protein MtrunA17_Chr4g0074141 [Medicago truncatula]